MVNVKIEYREPFRPFAPSVLVESASDYFALPDPARHYPARFMLYVAAGCGGSSGSATGPASPSVLVLLLLGGLIIFAQSSAIAPFIYTLF